MQNQSTPPIALQLYSLRHYAESFSQILDGARAAGFEYVQLIALNMNGSEVRAILDEKDLKAISAHLSIAPLEERFDDTVAFHRTVGNDTLVVAAPDQKTREAGSADGWTAFGRRLAEVGRRCHDEGFSLGYHNHWFEMELFDGKRAIDLIMDAADPEHLFWEPDLAWITKGGADVVEMLEQYRGRCPFIHAKDLAPEGENEDQHGVADVGYGTLDWNRVLPACLEAGARVFVVEHDLPADPIFNVGRSREFLQRRLAK